MFHKSHESLVNTLVGSRNVFCKAWRVRMYMKKEYALNLLESVTLSFKNLLSTSTGG